MANFALQISNFEKYGTFSYQFDEVGNVILNPSSSVFQQQYIDLPLRNVNYNNTKISSFYDIEFTEFTKPVSSSTSSSLPTDVIDQINDLTTQNAQLTDRLNNLIAQSELDNSAANIQLVRDIILALRIQLGQGSSISDFDTAFPYLPIPPDQKETA